MPSTSKSVLQRSAIISGLVSKDELEEAIRRVREPSVGSPAPRIEIRDSLLAKELVSMGLVTPYQAAQLKAGQTKLTLGPYIITDWIAQGGMGQVFKAEHQMMGREVAIKVLPKEKSTPSAISNFTREIRTQAMLDHENLVRAFDAGHDGNVYYLVCEYVPGTDLRRYVRSNGALSMAQAASLLSQAAAGLQHAHDKELIHRDIKPGNILVTEEGIAKVSDLGLAGFLSGPEEDPRKHKIVGTADYISPEQIKSPESVTGVSDIYSLGCTLYYAITGKVPYPGGTTREKARRHCEETPWHPRRFNSSVDEEFVEVIADMMEKRPRNRTQSAEEVVSRLEPWVAVGTQMPAQQPMKSPWSAPPLPATSGEEDDDLQATADGSYDSFDSFSGGISQLSGFSQSGMSHASETGNSTNTIATAETSDGKRRRRFPLLPMQPDNEPERRFSSVFVALAIAIPVSLIMGVLITLVTILLTVPDSIPPLDLPHFQTPTTGELSPNEAREETDTETTPKDGESGAG